MKKLARWALGAALCLSLLVCGAMAAEDRVVAVQLDGQALTFTDAAPQVVDQRTFLPFRAVFEAMGAQVDNQGDVITAVRGDRTLTMTLGSTQATVTEDGLTVPITMDVAPYVDPATWRTYVPVRFAAQAFDCAVGWDQDAYTAVIIDTEKLVDEALAGRNFTHLQQIMDLDGQYSTGIWDLDADFTMDMLSLFSMSGDIQATFQDEAKVDMDMGLKVDMSGLLNGMGDAAAQLDQTALDALDALAQQGVDLSARGDMAQGKLYLTVDLSALGDAAAQAGLTPDTWLEMDMASLMEQTLGMSWDQLMEMSQDTDYYASLLSALAGAVLRPDDAAGAYAAAKAAVNECVAAFSDEGFAQEGSTYTTSYVLPLGDRASGVISVRLDMGADGAPERYLLRGTLSTSGESVSALGMSVSGDRDGKIKADVTSNVNGQSLLDVTLEGAYTPGSAAPETEPPAGATVVPYTQLLAGADSAA